jgi:hypothetical protein
MAKTFVNANPWAWSQMRATYVHSERRYDSYQGQVGGNEGAPNYRLFDMANRSRDKGNFYWDFYLPQNIVLTPTGGFRYDDYTAGEQNANPLGLLQDQSWNAGVELAWKVLPDVTLMASYVHERGRRELKASRTSGDPVGFATNVVNEVDTFLVGANFIIIPKKFDIKATYTHVFATARINGGTSDVTVWPEAETRFHRLDVEGKYILDQDFTRRLGWVNETYVKLRYLFERNDVTDYSAVNWNYYQLFNGYSNATAAKSIYLGWDNPNYDVHLVALSFGAKW